MQVFQVYAVMIGYDIAQNFRQKQRAHFSKSVHRNSVLCLEECSMHPNMYGVVLPGDVSL